MHTDSPGPGSGTAQGATRAIARHGSSSRRSRRRIPLHMIPGRAMPSDSPRTSPRADAGGVRLVGARAVELVLGGAALICLVTAGAIGVIRLAPVDRPAQSAPADPVPDLAATRP